LHDEAIEVSLSTLGVDTLYRPLLINPLQNERRLLDCLVDVKLQPMRLRIAKSFDDPDYIFELKHDGFRALAYIEEGSFWVRTSMRRQLQVAGV
jgi:ATP-dependent DNA ligase